MNNDQLSCTPSALIVDPIAIEKTLPEKECINADRRPVRQRIPNRQFDSYIVPSIQPNGSARSNQKSFNKVSSSNSNEPSHNVDVSTSNTTSNIIKKKTDESIVNYSQKSKESVSTSVQSPQRFKIASICDVTLSWPKFTIQSTLFNGTIYTITNTCALDSVLFVYYFIFRTASTFQRNLFKQGSDLIYHILNKTVQLIDSKEWNIARLYWLTANNRLSLDANTTDTTVSRSHDIFGTVDQNVYQYLRAMQIHIFSTECSARDRPKRRQSRKSAEIVLR